MSWFPFKILECHTCSWIDHVKRQCHDFLSRFWSVIHVVVLITWNDSAMISRSWTETEYTAFCFWSHNKYKTRYVVIPSTRHKRLVLIVLVLNGPRQANLVLIAYASSEGSGEPAHPCSLARTFAARSYKQWVKRNLQTESQISGPSEWLGMRS